MGAGENDGVGRHSRIYGGSHAEVKRENGWFWSSALASSLNHFTATFVIYLFIILLSLLAEKRKKLDQ